MEIRPSPNQEALIRQAIEAGRFEHPEDALKEALALWDGNCELPHTGNKNFALMLSAPNLIAHTRTL